MRCTAFPLLLLFVAPAAGAGVPSPANSIVPCLRACPGGDVETTIIVKDLAGNPLAGSVVELRFDTSQTPCIGASLCVPLDASPVDYGYDLTFGRAFKATDASGAATFHLWVVGACVNEGTIRVTADAVLLADRPLASLDALPDWAIDLNDYDIVVSRLGTSDLRSDFVCDGVVTQEDADFVLPHLGHTCTVPLPVHESTWGGLKVIYR